MENSYEQGFAFILEAATELAFYDISVSYTHLTLPTKA